MPFPGRHTETGSLVGSWPIIPSAVSGVPVTLPRTIQSKASILGIQREPSAGFDVDGRSFTLFVDGVSYPVGFSYGALLPLSVVISQINAAVGSTVAFNDNGFLKLQSPTVGTGSLRIATDPSSTPTDVLKNLGLFAETYASAGDLSQTQNPDPDRQVASPGQMTMAEGESFEARVFNRAIAQLSINNDRNEGQISKKRLAVRNSLAVGSYSVPAGCHGVQVTDDSHVYVGKDTAPTVNQLKKIFAVLDAEGRELTKDVFIPQVTGYTGSFSVDSASNHQQVTSSAFHAISESVAEKSWYVLSNSFVGGASVLNGKPLKILEVMPGGGPTSSAIIENIDPSTGQRVSIVQGGVSFSVVSRERFSVVVDGVYDNETDAAAGTNRRENVKVVKRSGITPTRIELGNRIVCVGQDFFSAPLPQVGDLVTWSGSTVNSPFNNNGDYRIDRIIDKETLQVVSADWGAAVLNPSTVGAVGTISITSDGAFVKNPFIRFSSDTTSYAQPVASEALSVERFISKTFRDATDENPALFQGDLEHEQESDDTIAKAITQMWGPSVSTVDQVLYQDQRINIESLNSRLAWEHYTYDDTEKSGSISTDTRSFGRHKDIRPDTLDMWYWTPAVTTPRVILRGTGTRGHGSDSNTSGDHVLQLRKWNDVRVLNLYGDGRMTNHASTGSDSVLVWRDFDFPERTNEGGLGGTAVDGRRIIWRGSHSWTGSLANPQNASLCGQQLNTYLNLTTNTPYRFTNIVGQNISIGSSTTNSLWAIDVTFLDLTGNLQKSVTDYGDDRDKVSNLYGIHIGYTLAPNFKVGAHFGIKVEDITLGLAGNTYALYTGRGVVRFGDQVGIVPPTISALNFGLSIGAIVSTTAEAYGITMPSGISAASTADGVRIYSVSSSSGSFFATGYNVDSVTNTGGVGAAARGIYVGTVSTTNAVSGGHVEGLWINTVMAPAATSTGHTVYGVRVDNVSGGTPVGISVGNVSTSLALSNAYGIKVGVVSGVFSSAGVDVTFPSSGGSAYGVKVNDATVSGITGVYGYYVGDLTASSDGMDLNLFRGGNASSPGFAHGLLLGNITSTGGSSAARGIEVGNVTSSGNGGVAYGLSLGNVTANHATAGSTYGVSMNLVSTTNGPAVGLYIGGVSGKTNVYGIQINVVNGPTGYTGDIRGIYVGSNTSAAALQNTSGWFGQAGGATTNKCLHLGGAGGGTNTNNYGIYLDSVYGASNYNYAISIGTVSGAANYNYGIRIDNVSGASIANYALMTNAGIVRFGDLMYAHDTLPESNELYDLGDTSHRWDDLYVNSIICSDTSTSTANYRPIQFMRTYSSDLASTISDIYIQSTVSAYQTGGHRSLNLNPIYTWTGSTVSSAIGLMIQYTRNSASAASITSLSAIYVRDAATTAFPSVTSKYGILIDAPATTGNMSGVATTYGLYIGDQYTGSNVAYNIYSDGSATDRSTTCAVYLRSTSAGYGGRIVWENTSVAVGTYGGLWALSTDSTGPGRFTLSSGTRTGGISGTWNPSIYVAWTEPSYWYNNYTSGSTLIVANRGNTVNSSGLEVWCGDAGVTGTVNFFQAGAWNGGSPVATGALRTVNGVFQLVDLSDEKVKDEISPSTVNALELISALQHVEFKYKRKDHEGRTVRSPKYAVGYTAQNCEQVFPEMVSVVGKDADGEDIKGTNKAALIPVLTKAVQELKAMIDSLTSRIATLEA